MALDARRKLGSIVLIVVGLVFLVVTAVILFLEVFSPTHSAVSPENAPVAIRLALLVGLGWLFLGLGIGSRVTGRALSTWVFTGGAVLGMLMGFLAWLVIQFMLTS